MKKTIVLKMALITAMLSSSAFAMQQNNMPTFDSVFCTDNAGLIHKLAEYLDHIDKNNLREASSRETLPFIDLMIKKMAIHEINQVSLTRITNAANRLQSLKIDLINVIDPLSFPNFPVLKKLDLSDSNISADNMQVFILSSPQLEELNVNSCRHGPLGIFYALKANSAALQYLKKLNLSQTYILIHDMKAIIQHCPLLEELDLAFCDQAPNGIIQALQDNPHTLQNLKTLNLSYTNISTDNMHTIIQHCPQLEELNASSCHQTPEGIIQALQENPHALQNLKTLNLSYTNISTDNMHTIIQHCPLLEELGLASCSQTPEGIIQALQTNQDVLRNLITLNLSYTNISTDNMHTIIQHCPLLEELDLTRCSKAPESIIQALQENPHALSNLKKLDLCSILISAQQINFISQSIPHIQITLNR